MRSKALCPMIVAGTGHRRKDCEPENIVRTKARNALRYSGADIFICGGASGFDLWAADEAKGLELEVWLYRPWAGHRPDQEDYELYDQIYEYADEVLNVSEEEIFPGAWCYHARNERMVDDATHVLAYLNPNKDTGGTFACRNYAKKVGRPVRNIWNAAPF